MEKSTLHRLATKASRKMKRPTSRGVDFQSIFKYYLGEREMFFEHFSNLDFYYFFFYCYFMWSKGTALSQEELDELMNNVYVADIIDTNFYNVSETCSNCEGSGQEECINCGGEQTVECPECDGNGEDEEGEPCDVCEGSGIVPCSLCDGYGEYDCDQCDGTGEIEDESNMGFQYFFYFSTNSDEKNELLRSYQNNEPLANDFISYKLESLGPRGEDEMPFNETQNYETPKYYVRDLVMNPQNVGLLIKDYVL